MSAWTDRVQAAYDGHVDVSAEPVTVDIEPPLWHDAAATARDGLGCAFFDWLSAVDEGRDGFRLVCHLAAHRPGDVEHLLVRTLLAREDPVVASVADLFAGARWHERETHEMFGVAFTDDGRRLDLAPLLLPVEFAGHPLRKDFVLAARVARAWPGATQPGESASSPARTRSRRRPRPLGVPAPGSWPRDE